MLGFETISCVIFVAQPTEKMRPGVLDLWTFVPVPHGRSANIERRLIAGNIAHLLYTDDGSKSVTGRLKIGRGCERR